MTQPWVHPAGHIPLALQRGAERHRDDRIVGVAERVDHAVRGVRELMQRAADRIEGPAPSLGEDRDEVRGQRRLGDPIDRERELPALVRRHDDHAPSLLVRRGDAGPGDGARGAARGHPHASGNGLEEGRDLTAALTEEDRAAK